MLESRDKQPYSITGTTSPIYIPRKIEKIIRPGEDYFLVQIHSAQAAFVGSLWDRVKQLIVASQVNLSHPTLGQESLRAIQRSREVKRGRAEQLGLTSNLIGLVPAVMSRISISIEFILDKENRLAVLGGLINDDSFLTLISLAPGAAVAAKTISGLAQKVLQSFMPAEERQPILQFSGDFNLASGGLREGYYVILGTSDLYNPIPNPLPTLEVRDTELLANGRRVTQLSYVILDVVRTNARGRYSNDGALWEPKLREAEDECQHLLEDPLASEEDRKQAWQKCRNLIREAQALLRTDPNYLREEAEAIIKAVYWRCRELVSDQKLMRRLAEGGMIDGKVWQPDTHADRVFLDIPDEEDLEATLERYVEKVAEAHRILRERNKPQL